MSVETFQNLMTILQSSQIPFSTRIRFIVPSQRIANKINIKGNKAIIEGNTIFKGAELMATDLRASVSLVLAALIAKGKEIMEDVENCIQENELWPDRESVNPED